MLVKKYSLKKYSYYVGYTITLVHYDITADQIAKVFEALMKFKEAGIPTIVWLSPILPFINDTEENLRGILDYCIRAGVKGIICFGMVLPIFDIQLDLRRILI